MQIKTIRLFLVSSDEVLQPGLVCTVCSTAKLVGLFSLMMVSVPSRCELNASIVLGLNPPPSVPLPMGSVASTLPSSAFNDHADTGLGAHGKENVILHVQTEAARFAGAVAEVILGDELERFEIHDGDFLLVLDIHIQFSLPVALGLLHRAADINRAGHRAVLGINHRDARRLHG